MNEEKAMKAYKALRTMESAADLKRAGFALSDYNEACSCLQEYARNNGEDGGEEYTAEGKGFSIAYTAGKVTLAFDA